MAIPRHLAIIMDGNGRWAENHHLPRVSGHRRGVETVQSIVRSCRELGIGYLTLYAFSSENWGRPEEEVGALMGLLGQFLKSEMETMLTRGIRLRVIGEIRRLPAPIGQVLEEAVARTAENDRMVLTLALSYGARNELVRAARALAARVASGELAADSIDDETFASVLDTAEIPDPDLLIRTSGEMRISNFLLWQLAYTELYFTETLWPDFDDEQLQLALKEYGRRQRRFGLTAAQIHGKDREDPH
ncbi:undecaprenyl pyrophosphate synthetase [Desulfuromonas soudanensis]|uniref:Isoprenyl transferase n=1 Tax=Desulfuromonas soudanensis TaxID=1603606 RepID=A0A0M4D1R7_9BACT|nr:isoprenyl transferase [Desulfuromonas soudanensis]ALC16114.1 undecaprenyl pyrophosphate synthetase [Desulfuromonas soudanensis]